MADLVGVDETMFHLLSIVKCFMKFKDLSAAIWIVHCRGTGYNQDVLDGCIGVTIRVHISGAICVI